MNDLKFAFRQLLKNPGFTVVAVLTLALGIGANLAIFTFANSLLIRPLPGIHDADRLVIVKEQTGGPMSYPDYGDFRDRNSALTHLAAFAHSPFSLSADNLTERVMGEMVTGNYFRTLRVSMAAGRDFLPEEDQVASRNPVAIISYRLWQRRWNGDPAAVGKQVTINGHSFTIVGVAAERFRGCVLPIGDDLWVPIHAQPLLQASTVDRLGDRRFAWLERLVGRLKPDATLAQAQAEIALIGSQLQTAYPDDKKDQSFRAGAYNPFGAAGKPGNALIFLGILTAITVLVLCVVCANVANLFLARALARRREVAIRLALGSSRWRLVRQMLTEGFIIALLGAGLGTIAALGGAEKLFAQIPGHLGEPIAVDVAADGRVVGVGIVLALFSTLACGLLPALRTSALDLLPALKAGEASYSPRATRLRSALVVTQVALCAVLLAGAALLFRSLQLAYAIDPRLRIDHLLVAEMDPELNGYETDRSLRLYEELLPRISALPGVEAASLGAVVPLSGRSTSFGRVHGGQGTTANAIACCANVVGSDFFRTTGISLLRGREFSAADRRDAPRVVIVNQALATRLWPDQDALGQLLVSIDSSELPWLVVGVVSDSIYADLMRESRSPQPFYYLPVQQRGSLAQHLFVRTKGNPMALLPLVRQEVQALDPHLPLFHVQTLRTVRDQAFWQQRLAARLVSLAGWLAILLATLGLYSVMAQQVTKRTREIGIRMALGARRGEVLGLVVREGMTLAGAGIAIGLTGPLALARFLRSLLLGVGPTDPLAFTAVPLLLGTVALLACWLPARRAARVDPMEALRYE